MRVVMVIMQFDPIIGGAEIQARRLAQALQRRGVEVTILTGQLPNIPAEDNLNGLPIIRHPARKPPWGYMLGLAWALWRQRGAYDLIHIHQMTYAAAATTLISPLLPQPIICKPGNSGARFDLRWLQRKHPRFGARVAQQMPRRMARAVAISAAVEADLHTFGFAPKQVENIPNGVSLPAGPTPAVRASSRARLGIDENCVHLIFSGRLVPQKRLEDLLAAVARLPRGLDWQLSLIGDGRQRPLLEQLVATHNLHGRVTITGLQPDITPFLHSADIFVNPSAVEGLSNALLEALSYAIPAVVSDIPSNREVLEHEANGLLSPVGDPPALAAALQRLIETPTLREGLGAAGRLTVADRFAIERVADQYVELYAQLLPS